METIGYIASLLIGISLGLIGSGGSILTVPVLVYLFQVDAVLATGYSLFIVGSTALVGGVRAYILKQVSLKIAVVFAIPAFIAVFLTRRYLVPIIPQELFTVGGLTLTKDTGIMIFFALIMIAAALSMIMNRREKKDLDEMPKGLNIPAIVLEGTVVGVLTGLVGAGGGFLIIPALVLFAKLPMKTAVGTSLIIIAVKSLIGFTGDLGAHQNIDWPFLLTVSAIAIGGIFIGTWLAKYIHGKHLKVGFGWFVLVMAAYIIVRELFL